MTMSESFSLSLIFDFSNFLEINSRSYSVRSRSCNKMFSNFKVLSRQWHLEVEEVKFCKFLKKVNLSGKFCYRTFIGAEELLSPILVFLPTTLRSRLGWDTIWCSNKVGTSLTHKFKTWLKTIAFASARKFRVSQEDWNCSIKVLQSYFIIIMTVQL